MKLAFSSGSLEPGDSQTAPEAAESAGTGDTPSCARCGCASEGTGEDTLHRSQESSTAGEHLAEVSQCVFMLTFCELWHFIRRNEYKWGIMHQIVHCRQGGRDEEELAALFPRCCLLRRDLLRRYTGAPHQGLNPFFFYSFPKISSFCDYVIFFLAAPDSCWLTHT